MHLYINKIFFLIWLGMVALVFSTMANADPSARVARLSYLNGSVSFLPAGEQDWVDARLNRPLIASDRLWVDENAKVELQLGAATVWLSPSTDMTMLNLDNKTAQFQLSEGTLMLHIRHMATDQTYEIDTPNLAFTPSLPGDYRLDVDAQNGTTTVSVLSGQGIVYGENGKLSDRLFQ